jgi:hypothetical protein
VITPAGQSAISTADSLTVFDPAIGILVFKRSKAAIAADKTAGGSGDAYATCGATVVSAANDSTVLTAAHCIDEVATSNVSDLNSKFWFAPGFTGPFESCKGAYPKVVFGCGNEPYGLWTASLVATNDQWETANDHNLDYAFLVISPRKSGQTLQTAVGGGLPITFKDGSILGIDNPNNQQIWTLIGDRGAYPEVCTAVSYEGPDSPGPGPSNMQVNGCPFGSNPLGISGGPWVNSENGANNGVGAVNSTAANTGVDQDTVNGTYLGGCAEWLFGVIETADPNSSSPPFIQPIGETC